METLSIRSFRLGKQTCVRTSSLIIGFNVIDGTFAGATRSLLWASMISYQGAVVGGGGI